MRCIFLACLLLILRGAGFSQNIDSTLAKIGAGYIEERVFLHYDKATYAAGETIWFKAYILEGFMPATESKNFYVDWTDEQGKLLHRTVSPIVDGTTNGQFAIPTEFKGKAVHVKAYTNWMLNFDSAFVYTKNIKILSDKPVVSTQAIVVKTDITFFPEGGSLIEGVNNRVAFKAHDQWGHPVLINGTVRNKAGKLIDSLRVQHDGMGFFYVTPASDDVLTAKWKDQKGVEQTTVLPKVQSKGIAVHLNWSGDKNIFTLYAQKGSANNPGTVNIIGSMHQQVVFKLSKDITSGEAKGSIPADQLPSGVLTFTVFDSKWVPLAERIIFINNEELVFKPEFKVQHWGMNKRARNEIEIAGPAGLMTNFSVAITDAEIDTDSSSNIISHLLLTGDIKGKVYKPEYYISSNTDEVKKNLDLVMLTHGWRRFKWDDVAKGKLPEIKYPRDTAYLTLSGRVYGVLPSELREAGDIFLIIKPKKESDTSPGQEGGVFSLALNPDGTFVDHNVIIFDSTQIYYQFQKKRGLNSATVKFMENRLPAFSKNSLAKASVFNPFDTMGNWRHALLSGEAAAIYKQYEGKVLEEVIVKSQVKTRLQEMDEKYSSGMFSRGDGYQFDLVNDVFAMSAINIFTYLQGKVAGLQINNATGQMPSLSWRGGTPQIYLDEMLTDISMISSMPVTNIAYIKVFRPPFMGGASGGGGAGAIALYTRRGDDVKNEPGKGLASNIVTGYTELRVFYSPNYASFKPENERKDVRTTLYWNPQVITMPDNNRIKLSFYNNDVSNAFRVIIQGMTKDGRLAYFEEIME